MTDADNVSPTQAISAGLHRPAPWDALKRSWPDLHNQLGGIYDDVNEGVISVGASDWTEQDQLDHLMGVRSSLEDLGSDLNSIAEQDDNW